MFASIIKSKSKKNEREEGNYSREQEHETALFKSTVHRQRNSKKILRSQIILFNSRKKWGLLFAFATVAGLFCVPLSLNQYSNAYLSSVVNGISTSVFLLLPLSTLLIITGMYVFNDLVDADLDRANGKTKRPIPSGKVPKSHAIIFIIAMNLAGISVPVFMGNIISLLFALPIVLIGVLYSVPKISLKDRFLIKTLAIALAMMCSLLLGSSVYLDIILKTGNEGFLLPIFSGTVVALMVFVTSPLNDMGDISGDKQAGRRTIPIVIGKQRTVRLSLVIVLGMAIVSWLIYTAGLLSASNDVIPVNLLGNSKLILPLAISFVTILTALHLFKVLKNIDNQAFVRDSVSKKSIPLHILLQISLVIGCLLS